jgi:hypothetical protein
VLVTTTFDPEKLGIIGATLMEFDFLLLFTAVPVPTAEMVFMCFLVD